MPVVTNLSAKEISPLPPEELLKGKRHLTAKEIYMLIQNRNTSRDPDWQNVYVSENEGEFNVNQIVDSSFSGWVILGSIKSASLKFHDLELMTGIYRSSLCNVVTGDDCVVNNVNHLENYRLGNRVMLFNIQEMSCTSHSKFGEGILKEGENEKSRIWIGVGNENDQRAVLPFSDMIPADAYLWSRYREDRDLMQKFLELTEKGNDRKNNTYGIVQDDAVIKNCTLLKDAKIEKNVYIKGAFKIKNVTIHSSPEEPSQIGEGVELVNGIMGFGSRVFYQAVAVRFVIGRNCQLKYGARLLNSVLGDNSTVSCCELLNNLIFPFHEQHHNSSFLIAATIQGQSNIASAATIGSNHNSRSPDGEMIAGRGFWPGLCSDFKYDSKFASFTLVSKGSYQHELNIEYPFALVAKGEGQNEIHIIPAYWFLYNMFAIVRNKYKFLGRDKRVVKVQNIETNPLAPDTVQEIIPSLSRLVELTAGYLMADEDYQSQNFQSGNFDQIREWSKRIRECDSSASVHQTAKDFLHQADASLKFLLQDDRGQKKYGAIVYKPLQAYREYRRILKYFAVESLVDWCRKNRFQSLERSGLEKLESLPLFEKWINAGGQVIPEEKVFELFSGIKNMTVSSWQQVHDFYGLCQENYVDFKARYGLYILELLYSRKLGEFDRNLFKDLKKDVEFVSQEMFESSVASREKDYTDFFRSITFRNKEEQEAVLGKLEENTFLKELEEDTEKFKDALEKIFDKLS